MYEVDYAQLDAALRRAGSLGNAAECHGTLSGLACATPESPAANWVRHLLGPVDAAQAEGPCGILLEQLAADTLEELQAGQMAFQPLLPPDDAGLSLRAGALAHWCQGFLYGLSVGGLDEGELGSGDRAEVLSDFAQITRAAAGREADRESDERAYAELVEYVRVGAQLVFDELERLRRRRSGVPSNL